MRFMESPYYQQEVQDLEVLQRRVQEYSHIMQIMGEGDIELRKEFLHALYAMVEKEQNLYTRLQLDNSAEAKDMMAKLNDEAHESGVPPHHDLPSYHYELKNNIKMELKSMGEDLDSPVDID